MKELSKRDWRQQAERAISLRDKELWLQQGEWIKLAQEAEQVRGRQ